MLSLEPHLFLYFRIIFFIYNSLSFVIEIEVRHDVKKLIYHHLSFFFLKVVYKTVNKWRRLDSIVDLSMFFLIGFLCIFHGYKLR